MREAGHGRVFLLVERVELEQGMVGHLLRAEGEKLRADRIADRIGPVDQREEIRRDAQGHRRGRDAGGEVFVKAVGDERADRIAKLARVRDGVALLEKVGAEFVGGDMGEAGQRAPEFVGAEFAVILRLCGQSRGVNVCGVEIHGWFSFSAE